MSEQILQPQRVDRAIKKLKNGDLILIDLGARFEGYCGDLSRGLGYSKLNDNSRRILELIAEGSTKAISKVQPGIKLKEIDEASRSVLKEAGYDKYFIHDAIHGVGLDTEEESFSLEDEIEVGMSFVVMCAIYIPGFGVARLEDSVVVTDEGVKTLNNLNKLIVV